MNEPGDRHYDRRQLEKMRAERTSSPGELRAPDFSGAYGTYVLTRWCVQPGEIVRAGQTVAILDSDSWTIEVESFEEGTLIEQRYSPGDALPEGAVLGVVALAERHPFGNDEVPVPDKQP